MNGLFRLAPAIRGIILLIALGSVAAAAAPVVWHLSGNDTVLPARPTPRPPPPAAGPETVDLEPVLALAPFGSAVEEPEDDGPVEETSLELSLRGVITGTELGDSSAFIAHDGQTRGYRIGEKIAERATLLEVRAKQVVLDVDGERQTLSFPNADGSSISTEAVGEQVAPVSGPDRLRQLVAEQTARGAGPPPASESSRQPRPETTQDYIDLWRDRITANPAQVLDTIGLIPTQNGYRIAEEHDSGVRLAGLRPGDVVTSVNGEAVGDVNSDRRLYDRVAASGMARIEVLRDGRTITMSFPLE